MWQQNQSVGGKDRQAFIKQAAADRESRQRARDEKAKQDMELKAVLVVQRFARLSIAELRAKKKAANALDALVSSAPVQTTVPIPKRDATKPPSESTTKIPDKTVSDIGSQSVTDFSAKDLYDAIHTYLKMVAQRSARRKKAMNVSSEEQNEEEQNEKLCLHALLRCVLNSMETAQPAAQQYLGVATSNRMGWIAQVSELLSVVLTRLSTLRVTATPHTGGSLGKFKAKSQKDVAATQSGVGSQQLDGSSIAPGESNRPLPQPSSAPTITAAQEESLYLHALVILTDARSWHIVKSTPKLGALATVFQTLSRAIVTRLVEHHRFYAYLGRYMRSVALDKSRNNPFMPGNSAGVPTVTIFAMVTLALRPLVDLSKGVKSGAQAYPEITADRSFEFVWHCLSVPCLVELVDRCWKQALPIPFEDSLRLVIAVMKDREIARKFASVGDGLAESGSTSLDATDRRGGVPAKKGDMSGGEKTRVCGRKPGDVNRVLALYGNTVALGTRMIAIEKQRTPTSTEVTSTDATTTRATTTPEHTRAGPDTAHTRERYVQSLYSLTKVCLREIAASKERARTSSSATSELHSMLGMTSVRTGKDWKPVLHDVHEQVKQVWESALLHAILMEDLGRCCESPSAASRRRGSGTRSEGGKLLRRSSSKRSSGVVTRQGSSASADERREKGAKIIDLSAALRVCKACQLLYMLSSVFPNDKHMLWNRITCMPGALSGLYRLLLSVGPSGGMVVFLTAACSQPSAEVMLPILLLFCDCCTNLLVTLDDTDMYEGQKVLTLLDFRFLVRFLIRFIYNLIIVGRKKNRSDKCYKTSLSSTHALLRALRDRDSARNFTQESDWRLPLQILNMRQIDEILDTIAVGTPAHTKADSATIEAYNQLLLYMPHLIPFKRRVRLFRGYVEQDRPLIPRDVPTREITVRRGRVLEDGFTQLRNLSTVEFKQTFRVRFVNELGQDEIGIDQHGVFKEFLEDVIVAAFDAELGLFVSTADNRLYPSVLSAVQPEHLHLFYFVGRMLGKAVYEGVIEDVLLAHFFLNKILGRYNFRNELPSLDAELDKSLRFVKSYKGDLDDLCLTFSTDEDVFGETVTTDLVPGGSAMAVTNDNVIMYIYLMADHRMNKAIEQQSKAFVKGFTEVIHRNWLRLFSATDIQTLIAGDGIGGVDINNLMEHTQYGGGYSSGHRTVRNLWSVVKDELTPDQQRLFLKFVTSCSRV